MKDLLFVNAAQVVTCAGPDRARKGTAMRDAGILKNAAVAVSGGRIATIGAARRAPSAQFRIITNAFQSGASPGKASRPATTSSLVARRAAS